MIVGEDAVDAQQLPVEKAESFDWLVMCGAETAEWRLFCLGGRIYGVIGYLVYWRKYLVLFYDGLRCRCVVWDVLWCESHLSILANG